MATKKSPEPQNLHDAYAYWIVRAARALKYDFYSITRSHGYDLTQEQWFLLNQIHSQPGIIQNKIGDHLFDDRPNITRMLKVLENRHWIKRLADPKDKRRTQVFLTKKGEEILLEFTSIVLKERKRVYKGLTGADLKNLRSILDKLMGNLIQ